MNTVYCSGNLYWAAFITGPRHVWLALRLSSSLNHEVSVTKLKGTGSPTGEEPDPEMIKKLVLRSLSALNAESAVPWYCHEVLFVEDDSWSEELYERLALQICRAARDGKVTAGSLPFE